MKFKSNEKGFTMVELLAALSIMSAVVFATSMTISQIYKVSPQSNSWAIALRQVQDAGHWISRDVEMSQTVVVDTDPGTAIFLTLTLPQTPTTDKTVVYQLEEMPGGMEKLTRTDQDTGAQVLISQYISSTSATYDETSRKLTVTIAATSGDTTVTRQYQASQRVDPLP